ncbi:uncharacterized protein LAJ45_01255 [Morchella importuna]|uniref:uncharacterized protein n=1 Tax=Morchella importuna TaxID=1174673 RepID=UPI001E8D4FC0|nr:uncharacterized protein LAJ45_01255 [Morchella importuna]KAH8154724.1 hypothetical protein LAJ45_01255 [Morchella importuna]
MLHTLQAALHKLPTLSTLLHALPEPPTALHPLYPTYPQNLLTLITSHHNELLAKFETLKTAVMDAVSPPPPASAAAAAAGGATLSLTDDIIDNAISALQGLQTITETQETIAHLYPSAHQPHLGEATKLVSSFIASAAQLRSHCMREKDLLVPGCIDWYTAQAGAIYAVTPRPRELTFRLHGLARALEELCWCEGDEECVHSIIGQEKEGPEVIVVSVVHPGAGWGDVRRCLVAGIKAVTRLEGEVFGVVGEAVVVGRWGGGVIDEEVWGREWRDLDVVDVFWPGEDEEDEDDGDDGEYLMVSGSSMASGVRGASLRSSSSKDMWGIHYKTSPVSEKKSPTSGKGSFKYRLTTSLVDGSVKSEPTPSSVNSSVKPRPTLSSLDDVFKPETTPLSVSNSVKPEPALSSKASSRSAESIPGILKSRTSSTTKSTGSGCTVHFASATSSPSETVQERDNHLRRRVGSASLRAPSFLSPMKDDNKSQAGTVTHPYLKRGSGMNRKSMSALK